LTLQTLVHSSELNAFESQIPSPINGPLQVEVNGRTIDLDFRDKQTGYHYPNSAGLRFQAEEVRRQLYAKQISSEKMRPEYTILMADLNHEVLKQLNIDYPPTDRTFEFKQIE
jgi:hypothetical protein